MIIFMLFFLCPSFCLAMQEKDYSLYDYNGLTLLQRDQAHYDANRLQELPKKNCDLFIKAACQDNKLGLGLVLEEVRQTYLNYKPSEKARAFYNAESAMLVAKVLDTPFDYPIITKSQVHHMWRLGLKDISWVLACCRKYPHDAPYYIERFKKKIRRAFMKALVS